VLNAPVLATGQWVHVAVTLGAPNARLYVNGVNVASSNAITIRPSDFKPVLNYLGKSQWPDPLFNGRIDDFRLYNHVLSGNEVASLAAGPLSAPTGLNASPGPAQIQLTWNAVPFAASYTVRYATTSGGPYATLATGLASPSFLHAGLNYGEVYYYVVEASNLGGTSPATAPLGTTPQSALITGAELAAVRITVAVQADQSSVATIQVPASVAGHAYQAQYTPDLTQAWTNLGASQPGDGGELLLTLPAAPPSPRVFYRVLIQR
jgi:hypothetical protein